MATEGFQYEPVNYKDHIQSPPVSSLALWQRSSDCCNIRVALKTFLESSKQHQYQTHLEFDCDPFELMDFCTLDIFAPTSGNGPCNFLEIHPTTTTGLFEHDLTKTEEPGKTEARFAKVNAISSVKRGSESLRARAEGQNVRFQCSRITSCLWNTEIHLKFARSCLFNGIPRTRISMILPPS